MKAQSGAVRTDLDFGTLMNEICVRLGFCGSLVDDQPRHVSDYIPEHGPVTVDQFVHWVLIAEGWDDTEFPERNKRWRRELQAAFVKHMGADVVDASRLRYGFERSD